jgi:hypothetical protein
VRHIGPTAQDFRPAFGLGQDDRTIATIDESGVGLDANQALIEEKDVRRGSRALHASVIMDLHRGDLVAALESLEALQGCVRLYADDPTLVNYMFRVAIR